MGGFLDVLNSGLETTDEGASELNDKSNENIHCEEQKEKMLGPVLWRSP